MGTSVLINADWYDLTMYCSNVGIMSGSILLMLRIMASQYRAQSKVGGQLLDAIRCAIIEVGFFNYFLSWVSQLGIATNQEGPIKVVERQHWVTFQLDSKFGVKH